MDRTRQTQKYYGHLSYSLLTVLLTSWMREHLPSLEAGLTNNCVWSALKPPPISGLWAYSPIGSFSFSCTSAGSSYSVLLSTCRWCSHELPWAWKLLSGLIPELGLTQTCVIKSGSHPRSRWGLQKCYGVQDYWEKTPDKIWIEKEKGCLKQHCSNGLLCHSESYCKRGG